MFMLSGLSGLPCAGGGRGFRPPFDCRAVGGPLAAGAASVERLPRTLAKGSGGSLGLAPLANDEAVRQRRPFRHLRRSRLAGCSVTSPPRTPPANSPSGSQVAVVAVSSSFLARRRFGPAVAGLASSSLHLPSQH